MVTMIQQNWLVAAIVVLVALGLALMIRSRRRAPRDRFRAPDALDEGAAPAQRNRALIDAPSAAAAVTAPLAATGPDILGGIGEIAAWGAAQEVEHAKPAEAAPAPVASAAAADDLTRIKGVGPKLSARLAELGVTHYAQIASWSEADLARIDAALGAFAGRPARDGWIEQCRLLAAGDVAGYEAAFGKL